MCVHEGVVEPSMGLKNCTTTWPKNRQWLPWQHVPKRRREEATKRERERETKSETDGRLDGEMALLVTSSSSEETSDGFNFDLV